MNKYLSPIERRYTQSIIKKAVDYFCSIRRHCTSVELGDKCEEIRKRITN